MGHSCYIIFEVSIVHEGFKMEDYVGYTSRDLNAHYSYSGTSRNSFFEHVY